MTREEAIEYWEQFNAEIDDLYDVCSDADRDVLVKQREIIEYTISALRQQDVTDKDAGKNEPLTNTQKIRSMTDEELTKMLWKAGRNYRSICADPVVDYNEHYKHLIEWLKQPSGEEDKHEP